MSYLLDSHTWLWLAGGVELSREDIKLCTAAAAENRLYLSPLSVWEVARKASDGGIAVSGPIRPWISQMMRTTGVRVAEFAVDEAIDTAQLPKHFHRDPVDRGLAATCRVQGLTLLTRDGALLRLASNNVFRALPV